MGSFRCRFDPNCYFSLTNKSTVTVFVGRLQANQQYSSTGRRRSEAELEAEGLFRSDDIHPYN